MHWKCSDLSTLLLSQVGRHRARNSPRWRGRRNCQSRHVETAECGCWCEAVTTSVLLVSPACRLSGLFPLLAQPWSGFVNAPAIPLREPLTFFAPHVFACLLVAPPVRAHSHCPPSRLPSAPCPSFTIRARMRRATRSRRINEQARR